MIHSGTYFDIIFIFIVKVSLATEEFFILFLSHFLEEKSRVKLNLCKEPILELFH